MATFQIDDLIVSVLPETIEAASPSKCQQSGCTDTCSGCTDPPKSCSGCTQKTCSGCTNSALDADSPAGTIGNLEAFEALQEQLRRELDGAYVH